MHESKSQSYWFPAKKYGWGWGFPITWQGWAVLILFIVVVIALSILFNPVDYPLAFIASMIISSAALIAICYAKGEPPQWRWGDSSHDNSSR